MYVHRGIPVRHVRQRCGTFRTRGRPTVMHATSNGTRAMPSPVSVRGPPNLYKVIPYRVVNNVCRSISDRWNSRRSNRSGNCDSCIMVNLDETELSETALEDGCRLLVSLRRISCSHIDNESSMCNTSA